MNETPEQTLARWHSEESALRQHWKVGPGTLRPEDVTGRPGIELFRAMLRGETATAGIGATLDFLLVHADVGVAVFQGRPSSKHFNPMGTVHGGWYATLLDSALGCAVHTTVPAGKAYTTLELKVNLIRTLTDKVPLVRAEGRTVHVGGQTATAEARLVGHDGKLYAHGTTTCLIFDYPPKR